ncbi:SusD/RagB family nutrient-binding outer membrane lipoprotein [Tamlana sp. 2201CG12-4]|uniref:SusD/RagB family nutrient-binding outer membrane lipoprotein n=1 Tax=Tamlana sp. 2201CG12-4 TaxID=3112582 RepID=UPI002DBF2DF2|nr:SusD/RagB family nutrient-binding outer membrane lipoprotein [Tamlana sp. 2201CG12-4]MEC3908498.1 SusD/RagB family nutrient-binding outer membrane lipoprotein [Tamlana sp. 2201CG12-4]
MKKNIIYLLLVSLMVFSCEENFDEYNTHPLNAQVESDEVIPRFQLGPITDALKATGQISNQVAPEYTRQFSYNTSSYRVSELVASQYNAMWNKVYLLNPTINNVLNQTAEATDPVDIVVRAITKISKVYLFTGVSDLYGDIPYSESGDVAVQFPKYDTQEFIYNDGFVLIDQAIASLTSQISAGIQLPADDRVYGGDVAKWIRFANSLKLRLAMRLRAVDNTTSADRTREALEHNGGLISSHDQSATIENFDGAGPEHSIFQMRNEPFRMAEFLVDYLNNTNDPRLPIWADPAVNGGGLVGVDNSLIDFPDNDNFSRLSADNLFQRTLEDIVLMYSETEFLKAEAYLFGNGVSKDDNAANEAYRAGIKASLEYWGVEEADVNTFLAQGFTTLTGSDEEKLKQIGEQKWVSLFLTGTELWSEVRRLDYPEYPSRSGVPGYFQGDTNGEMPTRLDYPQNEATFNAENYDMANSKYPQVIASKLWWDVD